ncbi:MAG TPA: fatty acyl-AMP ligase, partial [Planctomycetaceae bacterium]|nr:fatty acyl-AMP ligase [Planctomycetaceae bacterium]
MRQRRVQGSFPPSGEPQPAQRRAQGCATVGLRFRREVYRSGQVPPHRSKSHHVFAMGATDRTMSRQLEWSPCELDRIQRQAANVVEVYRERAAQWPDRTAYTFLLDGEAQEACCNYREMDSWATAIAGHLQHLGAVGQRALLIFDPGLDYVAALVGCLYAGVVAVPAYPPDPMRLQRTMPRLQKIVEDCRARWLLTTTAVQRWAGSMLATIPGVEKVVSTDQIDASWSRRWEMPAVDRRSLALVQYTSGSTGSPKGVMVTHGNLLANMAQIHCKVHRPDNVVVSWLPAYHDMGLIGLLQAWYSARPMVFFSPLAFFQRPVRWLEAITRYRGTISPSPNFGYDLCVRKVSAEARRRLDLSSWRVAMNGAEPVRAETIDRFVDAFAPCGLRREVFYPCYGMAETTLMASGGEVDAGPVIVSVEGAALEQDRAVLARGGAAGA